MSHRSLRFTLAFIVLLAASHLLALPEDSKKRIFLEADDKFTQTPLGGDGERIVLSGNALVTQGSRQISGLKIVIIRKESTIVKVIATGNPASFLQKTSQDKEPVTAQANEIQYVLANESLRLKGDATINQQGSVIRSDIINYDMALESVSASSTNGQTSRVKIELEPRLSKDNPSEPKPPELKPSELK